VLAQLGLSDTEKQSKIAMQERVNAAALKGTGWEGIPNDLRAIVDTPFFQSVLAFDPARVIDDVRQPLLILQGELDTQVRPHHADRLAELARARDRKPTTEVVKVPGVNHLFVPAKTGEVREYPTLPEKQVSSIATGALTSWLARQLR
jgi:uncharacterized protein